MWGSASVVPAGTTHNIINTDSVPLKLYTLYASPNHRDGIVHHVEFPRLSGRPPQDPQAPRLKESVVRAAVGIDRGGDPEDPKMDCELKVADLIRNCFPVDPVPGECWTRMGLCTAWRPARPDSLGNSLTTWRVVSVASHPLRACEAERHQQA
jgi:hypothetical protein